MCLQCSALNNTFCLKCTASSTLVNGRCQYCGKRERRGAGDDDVTRRAGSSSGTGRGGSLVEYSTVLVARGKRCSSGLRVVDNELYETRSCCDRAQSHYDEAQPHCDEAQSNCDEAQSYCDETQSHGDQSQIHCDDETKV